MLNEARPGSASVAAEAPVQSGFFAWMRAGEDGIRSHMVLILAGFVAIGGGLGSWAAVAPLAGAVMSPATVVVDSRVKKVQHLTGGIVSEIAVKNGDHVRAGDLLVRLDDTVARANLQIIVKQLDQLAGRQARLVSERDGAERLMVPPALESLASHPDVAAIIAEEARFFDSRRAAREGLRAQLGERLTQLGDEIAGLAAQEQAKEREIAFIRDELKGVRDLYKRNLVQLARLNALERDAARLEGERGQLVAAAAQARGKMAEIRLQALQIDQDLRSEVSKDLREQQAKEAELIERRVAAENQLRQIDIRSPQNGIVHELSVFTVGGVVGAGESLMLIVPEGDALVLEAKIAPQDIDHVRVGQPALVRLSAFNQRRTPEVAGTVAYVAADLTKDNRDNRAYYLAFVKLDEDGLKHIPEVKLVPGMPAEVHLQTGERTALSYFLKPFSDQVARAFKEP
jgi:HlyD family secretion protein